MKNKTYNEWLNYYENATKEQVITDLMIDWDTFVKWKNVLDKIKNKIDKELKEGRPTEEGKPEDYLWLMGYYDANKDINELLKGSDNNE